MNVNRGGTHLCSAAGRNRIGVGGADPEGGRSGFVSFRRGHAIWSTCVTVVLGDKALASTRRSKAMGMLSGTDTNVISTRLPGHGLAPPALEGSKPVHARPGSTVSVCLARVTTRGSSIVKAGIGLPGNKGTCISVGTGPGIATASANGVFETGTPDARSVRAPSSLVSSVTKAMNPIRTASTRGAHSTRCAILILVCTKPSGALARSTVAAGNTGLATSTPTARNASTGGLSGIRLTKHGNSTISIRIANFAKHSGFRARSPTNRVRDAVAPRAPTLGVLRANGAFRGTRLVQATSIVEFTVVGAHAVVIASCTGCPNLKASLDSIRKATRSTFVGIALISRRANGTRRTGKRRGVVSTLSIVANPA